VVKILYDKVFSPVLRSEEEIYDHLVQQIAENFGMLCPHENPASPRPPAKLQEVIVLALAIKKSSIKQHDLIAFLGDLNYTPNSSFLIQKTDSSIPIRYGYKLMDFSPELRGSKLP